MIFLIFLNILELAQGEPRKLFILFFLKQFLEASRNLKKIKNINI